MFCWYYNKPNNIKVLNYLLDIRLHMYCFPSQWGISDLPTLLQCNARHCDGDSHSSQRRRCSGPKAHTENAEDPRRICLLMKLLPQHKPPKVLEGNSWKWIRLWLKCQNQPAVLHFLYMCSYYRGPAATADLSGDNCSNSSEVAQKKVRSFQASWNGNMR